MQVAAADTGKAEESEESVRQQDSADKSIQEIRIKRLRLADPESTETMLAGPGLHPSHKRPS